MGQRSFSREFKLQALGFVATSASAPRAIAGYRRVFTATDRTVGLRTASYGGGIGSIVLVALDVGLNVAGRHQPHDVAELLELPRPMMR